METLGKILMGVVEFVTSPFTFLFKAIGGMFGRMFSGMFSGGSDNESSAPGGGSILSGLFNAFSGPSHDRPAPAPAAESRVGSVASPRASFSDAADVKPASYVTSWGTPGYDAAAARAKYGATDVRALDPQFQAPVERIMERLRAKGWDPVIGSGIRDQKEQDEKVAEGVSAATHSHHQDGLAVDIVQRGVYWKGPAADKNYQFWKDLQAAAEAEGMTSGAVWTKAKHGIEADVAHVQMRRGKSEMQYVSSNRPHGHDHAPGVSV